MVAMGLGWFSERVAYPFPAVSVAIRRPWDAKLVERAGYDHPNRSRRPAPEQLMKAQVAQPGAVPFFERDQPPVLL